jgi:hypothetical protein
MNNFKYLLIIMFYYLQECTKEFLFLRILKRVYKRYTNNNTFINRNFKFNLSYDVQKI